jgi:PAS domain S-box-containing protein
MITVWLIVYGWQRRHSPGVTSFLVMVFFGSIWLSAILLMLLSPSQNMALFWYRMGFISVSVLPVLLLVFIAQYSESRVITPIRLIVLFIVPFVTQIAVWTDDHFHTFLKTITIVEKGGLMVIHSWSPGSWFIVHSVYSFAILFAALTWLFVYAIRQFRVFRSQSMAFIVGALMVILPNLAFAIGLIPPDIIVLPFCFLLMGLFFAWAIFRHKLFKIVPVARNKMVDIMSDGMIVFDTENRLVDINPMAKTTLSLTDDDVVGQSAERVFSPWPDILDRFLHTNWAQTEIVVPSERGEVHYDVRITALVNRQERPAGRLILFRDITERKKIEQEKDRLLLDLKNKNEQLEMLIQELQQALESVKTLSGLLPICSNCKKIRNDQGYWEQVEGYIAKHSEADFTHGICPDCVRKLYPELKRNKDE